MHMHLAAGVYIVVTCITNCLQKIKYFMNVHCVLINSYSSFQVILVVHLVYRCVQFSLYYWWLSWWWWLSFFGRKV